MCSSDLQGCSITMWAPQLGVELSQDTKLNFRSNSHAFDTSFQPSTAATESVAYILPPADGDDNQVLKTNGAGQLSWTSFPVAKVWARETGNIDGSDQVTLAHAPIAESLIVFVSGVMMRYGVDYEVDGAAPTKLTFNLPGGAPPIVAADDIYIQYQY